MASRLSRRKIAHYAVTQVTSGKKYHDVIKEVAAYLVQSRRTRELGLLVRDIEGEFADRGIVVADVTSARALTDALKKQIAALVGAKDLQVRETIDPSVIGGVRIDIPGKRLDATVKRTLLALKAQQQV